MQGSRYPWSDGREWPAIRGRSPNVATRAFGSRQRRAVRGDILISRRVNFVRQSRARHRQRPHVRDYALLARRAEVRDVELGSVHGSHFSLCVPGQRLVLFTLTGGALSPRRLGYLLEPPVGA